MKRLMQENLIDFKFYGNLTAKDGRLFYKEASVNLPQNRYDYRLWSYAGGRQQLLATGVESDFGIDSKQHVFITRKSPEDALKSNLYQIDATTGSETLLATLDLKEASLVAVVSDNQLLLKVSQRPQTNDDFEIFTELPFWDNGKGITSGVRARYYLYNIENGYLISLLSANQDVSHYFYDEQNIYLAASEGHFQIGQQEPIWKLDKKTATATKVFTEKQLLIHDFFTLAGQLYVLGSDCLQYGLNEHPNFYKVVDGKAKLVAEFDGNLGNMVTTDLHLFGDVASRVVADKYYFVSTYQNYNRIYVFDGNDLQVYLEFSGPIWSFDFIGDKCYFLGSSADGTEQIYEASGSLLKQCSDFNNWLDEYYLAKTEEITWQDSKGGQQKGWVLYPKDFSPTKTYPAILDIHGGPKGTYGQPVFHEMQVWANDGYFVFFTNIHGSEGFGDEYADIRGEFGRVDYDDLMTFTDQVLDAVPQIDCEHLGVTGGSYGGVMTNWIIGHTNRFKVAATQRSIANWLSMADTSDIGRAFTFDLMGTTTEAHPERLWDMSPLKYVENISTPTLVFHSDEDYRCPVSEGYQFFGALQAHGVESRMCVIHGENHELSRSGRPRQRLKRLEEITTWLEQHLSF